MISCTEFIPAYSELFWFLEHTGGKEAVLKYWEYISQNGISKLWKLASARGLRGCYDYWAQTLKEEAADFTMSLDEEKGVFILDMHRCPSKARLLSCKQLDPYPDYCGHCETLYCPLLRNLGFECEYDMSRCHLAACKITIRLKQQE